MIDEKEEADILVEDTKSVFNRTDGSSLGRMIIGLDSNPAKSVPRFVNELYDSPELVEPSEYLTPVVRNHSSLTVIGVVCCVSSVDHFFRLCKS